MQVGDLVKVRCGNRYGIILFIDDEVVDCFGILFAGRCDWCFGYSEELEVLCK